MAHQITPLLVALALTTLLLLLAMLAAEPGHSRPHPTDQAPREQPWREP